MGEPGRPASASPWLMVEGIMTAFGYGEFTDTFSGYSLLDRIMYEIPGKNNYAGHMQDESFGMLKYRKDTKTDTVLNTAFYHRFYKVLQRGAMGLTVRHRGYADRNLWVASTTQDKIAELGAEDCHYDSHTHKKVCPKYKAKYTYALPLEIIWLTPLSKWNPYNLTIHDPRHRNEPTKNGHSGGLEASKAFNGTSMSSYYLTPAEFFHPGEVDRDPADTARDTVGVLDQQGNDVVMKMNSYKTMFEEEPDIPIASSRPKDSHFVTQITHMDPPGMHHHDLYLTVEQMHALRRNGTRVHVYTSLNNGHQHELVVTRDPHRQDENIIKYVLCDGKTTCWDRHGHNLHIRHDD